MEQRFLLATFSSTTVQLFVLGLASGETTHQGGVAEEDTTETEVGKAGLPQSPSVLSLFKYYSTDIY